MPTLAEILSGIDSVVTPTKRRLADLLRNPRDYTSQSLGMLGDSARQFAANALQAREGAQLDAAGSVMGGLPQYRNALDSVTNTMLGAAPLGTIGKGQYSPDMSAQKIAEIRAQFHKSMPTRDLAEREFSQWLANPAQLSAEDIAGARSWFHERAPTRDLAERQFSQWLNEKGLFNP